MPARPQPPANQPQPIRNSGATVNESFLAGDPPESRPSRPSLSPSELGSTVAGCAHFRRVAAGTDGAAFSEARAPLRM